MNKIGIRNVYDIKKCIVLFLVNLFFVIWKCLFIIIFKIMCLGWGRWYLIFRDINCRYIIVRKGFILKISLCDVVVNSLKSLFL